MEIQDQQPIADSGIEILVGLARRGEIDPWDVDIVTLTDKYLSELDSLSHRSLPLSGRAIFYGCVLLNMKARRVYEDANPPVPDPVDDFVDEFDEGDPGDWAQVVATQEGVLLLHRNRPRTRRITLNDLIDALKRCESEERKRVDSGFAPTSAYFIATTHQEDIDADIEMLKSILSRYELSRRRTIGFEEIVSQGMNRVCAFTALLHMAAHSDIDLVQKTFYKDLAVSIKGDV